MGINTGAIGYETQKKTVVIDEESVRNYLEAINSVNPFYSKSKYVPPMFNVVLEIAHIQELWESEELHGSKEEAEKNVLMLVHGEQKMIFKRLLKRGEEITTHSLIEDVQDKGKHYIIFLKSVHEDSNAKEVGLSYWTLFIRAEDSKLQKNTPKKESKPKPQTEIEERNFVLDKDFHIPDGITHKYAEASGDHNKIHIDLEYAKKAGLEGVIVHGLCTMAMAIEQITDNYFKGLPGEIKDVNLRFSSPVWPGTDLTVRGWLENDEVPTLSFEVNRLNSNTKVIKSGHLNFRPAVDHLEF